MLTAPFIPEKRKKPSTLPCVAFGALGPNERRTNGLDLCDAAERADEVLRTLEEQDSMDRDTRLQVVQLKILLRTAKQTLEAVQDEPLAPVIPYPVNEEQEPMLGTIFPVGTILECPDCGAGLYEVLQEVSTAGLVLDDGAVLVPLNQTILARDVWKSLACPFCGGRLLKEGKIHTLQAGWR